MGIREDLGSWLVGPEGDPRGPSPRRDGLGLPADGPGSPARPGRRIAALFIDWFACLAVSSLIVGEHPMATVGVFAVENLLLVATLGTTLGHRLLGLRVIRLGSPGRGAVGLLPALVRTVLLCLVIPAVVWDQDGRGVHDRAAGTVIVRS